MHIVPTAAVTEDDYIRGRWKDPGKKTSIISSSTILNILSSDAWDIYIPIDCEWDWKTIAFRLATMLHLKQLDHEKESKKPFTQISGWNGTALIEIALYVKVPDHYDAARRQRAVMGLESPSSLTDINAVELGKIAVGAATGYAMGPEMKFAFPYTVSSTKCIWGMTTFYNFAESDSDFIRLSITRVNHAVAGITAHDEKAAAKKNSEKILKMRTQAPSAESVDLSYEECIREPKMPRAMRTKINQANHAAEQAEKEAARRAKKASEAAKAISLKVKPAPEDADPECQDAWR